MNAAELNARAELIERVGKGALTPEQAEEKAELSGLPPLATSPPGANFRAEELSHWSLPMALEWILSRNYDEVRRFDDRVRRASQIWVCTMLGPETFTWGLERDRTSTTGSLATQRVTRNGIVGDVEPSRESVSRARTALWEALKGGRLTAVAVREKARTKIPEIDWHDLEPHGLAGEQEALVSRGRGATYRNVSFSRIDLEELWPAPAQPALRKARRPACENDERAFRKANGEAYRSRGRCLTKVQTDQWCEQQNVSRAWGRAQRQRLPQEWIAGRGRPKPSAGS